jgi:hypothetical protein
MRDWNLMNTARLKELVGEPDGSRCGLKYTKTDPDCQQEGCGRPATIAYFGDGARLYDRCKIIKRKHK